MIRMMNGPDDFIGPVNLGNPGEFTILELAEAGDRADRQQVEDRPPSRCRPTTPRGASPTSRSPASKLGWEPTVPLREGLQKTIDWFRSIKWDEYRAPTPNY